MLAPQPISIKLNSTLPSPCVIGATDCEGKRLCTPDDFTSDSNLYRLIRVDDNTDFYNVVAQAAALNSKHFMLRVVTDQPLPDYVIQAVSYSPHNILQYSLDILNSDPLESELRQSICFANTCGILVSLLIHPITRMVTPMSYVMKVMDAYHYFCRHFALKFSEDTTEGFIDWYCSKVNKLLESRKITCSVCNIGKCY